MARPLKPDCEKRNKRFNLRFTESEIEQIHAQADAMGINPHEYVRNRVLGHRIQPKSEIKQHASLIREINAIGNNVNQLALSIHRGSDFIVPWKLVYSKLELVLSKVSASYDP